MTSKSEKVQLRMMIQPGIFSVVVTCTWAHTNEFYSYKQVMWPVVTEVRSKSFKILLICQSGTWRPLVSVFTTHYYAAMRFHQW